MSPALRVVVVDDEPLARESLKVLLGREPDVELVRECGDGTRALEAIRELQPDVLFLDVQMPVLGGFEVLEAARREVPSVIFVTASREHAVRAFDFDASDFLLKPFDDERFMRALDRARARVGETRPRSYRQRLVSECAGRVTPICVDDVDWIEAQDYYALVHVGAEEHLLRESLRRLEQELNPRVFARIHRSAIVNVTRVKELRRCSHGEYLVLLRDGTELKLSRTHRDRLKILSGA